MLAYVHERVAQVNNDLPSLRRDREKLLKLNVDLHELERQMRPHANILKQIATGEYQNADLLLQESQKFISSALLEHRNKRRSLEQQIAKTIQREIMKPSEEESRRLKELPDNLMALIDSYGLTVSQELQDLLRHLDETILRPRFTEDEYRDLLLSLREFMEERL